MCLRVSVAIKRRHKHDNFYKEKHLIGATCLQFRVIVHYHDTTLWHAGRCGAGTGVESSYTFFHRQQKVVLLTGCSLSKKEISKPNFDTPVTHFLQ